MNIYSKDFIIIIQNKRKIFRIRLEKCDKGEIVSTN